MKLQPWPIKKHLRKLEKSIPKLERKLSKVEILKSFFNVRKRRELGGDGQESEFFV
jgi:hypothetical protein